MELVKRKDFSKKKSKFLEERQDLACAFRLASRMGMDEGIANHFSLRVNGSGTRFIMNQNKQHFSRIKASDLLLLDADDPKSMKKPESPDPTAWGLHGAIHRYCSHVRCIMHLHPIYSTVLASLADSSLPPIDQRTVMFYKRYVIDEKYGGLAFKDEGERCASLLNDKKVKVIKFRKIKFSQKTNASLYSLDTKGKPNRHMTKQFQWHKLNLFDTKLKTWDYIFYIDINMHIHYDINPILEKLPREGLFARADGYPDYQRKLTSQFDLSRNEFSNIKNKYDLEIDYYFQTGILFYDTSIIQENTKANIVSLVEEFPISKTNEQGIMNLYFIFEKNQFNELPLKIGEYVTYYYWLIEGKKIIITKQLSEQYK